MNRALLKKSIHESRLLLAGCALWLFAFSWMRVWIISRMERSRFELILEQFGDLVETVSPVAISHLVSFTGRVALGYDDALVVFVTLAFAIARGSDVVSGEINRGTMEMLLAQPVSRWQVLSSQATVTTACLVLLAIATWLGNWAGVQTMQARVERPVVMETPLGKVPIPFAKPHIDVVPMRTQVDSRHLVPASVNLFCMALCFTGLASFLSAWDRYRWRTVGLSIAVLVIQTITKIVGLLVESWSLAKYFSLLTAYEPQWMVEVAVTRPLYTWALTMPAGSGWTFGPLAYNLLLAGFGVAFYAAAGVVFSRRDLPAPL